MKKTILILLGSIFLMSCGHYADGTSVYAGGLFIVPLLGAIGAVLFFRAAYLSSKSGSNINPGGEGGNVSIFKHPLFWFSVVCAVATIVWIIMINADK